MQNPDNRDPLNLVHELEDAVAKELAKRGLKPWDVPANVRTALSRASDHPDTPANVVRAQRAVAKFLKA